MKNKKIINYIKEQLELGHSKEEIKEALLEADWSQEDIDKAFNFLNQKDAKINNSGDSKKRAIIAAFSFLFIASIVVFGFYFLNYNQDIKQKEVEDEREESIDQDNGEIEKELEAKEKKNDEKFQMTSYKDEDFGFKFEYPTISTIINNQHQPDGEFKVKIIYPQEEGFEPSRLSISNTPSWINQFEKREYKNSNFFEENNKNHLNNIKFTKNKQTIYAQCVDYKEIGITDFCNDIISTFEFLEKNNSRKEDQVNKDQESEQLEEESAEEKSIKKTVENFFNFYISIENHSYSNMENKIKGRDDLTEKFKDRKLESMRTQIMVDPILFAQDNPRKIYGIEIISKDEDKASYKIFNYLQVDLIKEDDLWKIDNTKPHYEWIE